MIKKLFFPALLFLGLSLSAQNNDIAKDEQFTIHAQTTIVNQNKLGFSAKYSDENSLTTDEENQTSLTSTLYLGARLWKGASVYLNPEIAGGSGLSKACGVAASTNGETFRVGDPQPKIYLARLYYRQLFALTDSKSTVETDINQLGGNVPDKYLGLTVGRISVADFFDCNEYSHDPRTQFLSWGLMSTGAYDYPANTRGYTPSVVVEYVSPKHELRYGVSLVPLTANANEMNWDIANSTSHVLEYTHKHIVKGNTGAIRILSFFTTTNMGNYNESVIKNPTNPDIESTRAKGRTKYGFALNAEQQLNSYTGCFFRASWNDGNNETWAFTEIDRSLSAGLSISGDKWKRKNDRIGIAQVISGLSKPHRDYLAAGGKGFMLGDGQLSYANECLTETYYSAELVKNQLYLTGSYQLLFNPGYNKDRQGPVNVFSVRLHLEI
ncbi:MAG: carbohydrate porin [Bacteroidales bacterium]